MAKNDPTRALEVHEDQLLEAGHSILARDFLIRILNPKFAGKETPLTLGGVRVRVGDLILTQWGQLVVGKQLAFVTGVSADKKRLRVMKFRGKSTWTQPQSVDMDRVLDRAPEARIISAMRVWSRILWPNRRGGSKLGMDNEERKALFNLIEVYDRTRRQNRKVKAEKSLPVYMLGDRYLNADGTLGPR